MLAQKAKAIYFSFININLSGEYLDDYWDAIAKESGAAEVDQLKAKYPDAHPKAVLLAEAMQDRVVPDDKVLADFLMDYHHDKIWVPVPPEDIENSTFAMSFELEDGRKGVGIVPTVVSPASFEVFCYAVGPEPELSNAPG